MAMEYPMMDNLPMGLFPPSDEGQEIRLDGGQEFRIEIDINQSVSIMLEDGRAEKFGEELPPGTIQTYKGPDKFAIFTWHGCKLRYKGERNLFRLSGRSNHMDFYLHAHARINAKRDEACRDRKIGPIVLIAGGASSGKTMLSKILLNYAVKQGWRPIYVELDVSQSDYFLPACISASTYGDGKHQMGLAYYFGHLSVSSLTSALFKLQISELARYVNQRLQNELEYTLQNHPQSYSPRTNQYASGVIIDFPPFHDLQFGSDILSHIVNSFHVDNALVIDSEKLHLSLQNQVLDLIYLQKSGGVVTLDSEYKTQLQHHLLYTRYFHRFSIHTLTLQFSQVRLYKIRTNRAPSSAFTYGANEVTQDFIADLIAPTQDILLNSVLGVIINEDDILTSPIYGVVHVVEVDEPRKEFKIFSPGELPALTFVIGSWKGLKQQQEYKKSLYEELVKEQD